MLREDYLLHGCEHLGDADLIALLLGTGAGGKSAREIAAALLDTYGSLGGVAEVSPQALARVRGLGPVRAIQLHAALQLGRRAFARQVQVDGPLQTADAAASWLAPFLNNLRQEELHALFLDRRLRPIARRRLSLGSDSHTIVDSRTILRVAVEIGATAIVLAHNHPSGDAEPSIEDIQVTRSVARAAETVGITLLDHLVIANGRWTSLAERGLVSPSKQAPRMVAQSAGAKTPRG